MIQACAKYIYAAIQSKEYLGCFTFIIFFIILIICRRLADSISFRAVFYITGFRLFFFIALISGFFWVTICLWYPTVWKYNSICSSNCSSSHLAKTWAKCNIRAKELSQISSTMGPGVDTTHHRISDTGTSLSFASSSNASVNLWMRAPFNPREDKPLASNSFLSSDT